MMTARDFTRMCGRLPEHDDLKRCNCEKAGEAEHMMCGICPYCNKPRFICGHMEQTVDHPYSKPITVWLSSD